MIKLKLIVLLIVLLESCVFPALGPRSEHLGQSHNNIFINHFKQTDDFIDDCSAIYELTSQAPNSAA